VTYPRDRWLWLSELLLNTFFIGAFLGVVYCIYRFFFP
jgi:uncharacterized membrane protein